MLGVLTGTTFTVGDLVGACAVAVAMVVPVTAGLWKIASTMGSVLTVQEDHNRRLEVIETALVEGPAAGRRKRELFSRGDPGMDTGGMDEPYPVRPLFGAYSPGGDPHP